MRLGKFISFSCRIFYPRMVLGDERLFVIEKFIRILNKFADMKFIKRYSETKILLLPSG